MIKLTAKQLRDLFNGYHKINPNGLPFVTIIGGEPVHLEKQEALHLISWLTNAINDQLLQNEHDKLIADIEPVYCEHQDI